MGYFPFFVDLAGRRGLVVGGGAVALRKVRKLLPYDPLLTVVAPAVDPALEVMEGLTLLRRPFALEDLEGCVFAIAATGDRAVNREVARLCRERRVLVNVADRGGEGTFLFPALVKRGDLSVGVSTGGAFPLAGVYVKERLEELLPEDLEAVLAFLNGWRERLKAEEPNRAARNRFLKALCRAAMERGRPLEPEETAAVLAAEKGE